MQLQMYGKNIEITEALRDYVERKTNKLERYFDEPLHVQVTLSVQREKHIAEVTIPYNGLILRGEEATQDMYVSVDKAVEKIERQIRKYKTRINRKLRKEETLIRPNLAETLPDNRVTPDEIGEEEFPIVRVKRFTMKPMDVEEAVLQMNLLGHDFFVFRNAETEKTSVVYRRRDGGYGLIEPGV